MAKVDKATKRSNGPFVACAVLCSSVTEDSDGVLSAQRIVDEIRVLVPHDAPKEFPSKSQPIELNLFALIIVRRGDSPGGKRKLRLTIESPDGKASEAAKVDIQMPEHPNGAATARIKMSMKMFNKGTYWIDVFLGNYWLTRMALNLQITRLDAPGKANP